MAISRREILKLGVSYGTGTIHFGNDSLRYDRELRKVPQNTLLQEFLDQLEAAEVHMMEEAVEAEAQATEATTEEAMAAEAVEPAANPKEEPTLPESEQDTEETEETPDEEDIPNPLEDAIKAAEEFRAFCGQMAFSDLGVQTTAIINTMREAALPAVADIAKLKEDYGKIVAYLQHC